MLLTLFVAVGFSILLAYAAANFRRGTPESVARAVKLMPRNTEYLALRALQLDYDGEDSKPLLGRIASLAPYASAPRIRLGLAAEVRGDFDTAEKWLLEAARIDRQFEPRWTLANYYFRRQNTGQFWNWMRRALEFSYGDRRPAFDLCWRASGNAAEILERAIPDRREVLGAYLAYLMEEHRLSAAAPVALKLAAAGDPDDRPLLLSACDTLLEAGDGASAGALWRALGYPLHSGIGNDPSESAGNGHGFDWRAPDVPGVNQIPSDGVRRITLSGRQPESCELLRRFVSLQPQSRYVLRWQARAQSLGSPSGLEWRIAGQHMALMATVDWQGGELRFTVPSGLAVLTLAYQRPPGQPRAEGWVELRNIEIVEAR